MHVHLLADAPPERPCRSCPCRLSPVTMCDETRRETMGGRRDRALARCWRGGSRVERPPCGARGAFFSIQPINQLLVNPPLRNRLTYACNGRQQYTARSDMHASTSVETKKNGRAREVTIDGYTRRNADEE